MCLRQVTSQLRQSLVVHPLLEKKNLDPPLRRETRQYLHVYTALIALKQAITFHMFEQCWKETTMTGNDDQYGIVGVARTEHVANCEKEK